MDVDLLSYYIKVTALDNVKPLGLSLMLRFRNTQGYASKAVVQVSGLSMTIKSHNESSSLERVDIFVGYVPEIMPS